MRVIFDKFQRMEGSPNTSSVLGLRVIYRSLGLKRELGEIYGTIGLERTIWICLTINARFVFSVLHSRRPSACLIRSPAPNREPSSPLPRESLAVLGSAVSNASSGGKESSEVCGVISALSLERGARDRCVDNAKLEFLGVGKPVQVHVSIWKSVLPGRDVPRVA